MYKYIPNAKIEGDNFERKIFILVLLFMNQRKKDRKIFISDCIVWNIRKEFIRNREGKEIIKLTKQYSLTEYQVVLVIVDEYW